MHFAAATHTSSRKARWLSSVGCKAEVATYWEVASQLEGWCTTAVCRTFRESHCNFKGIWGRSGGGIGDKQRRGGGERQERWRSAHQRIGEMSRKVCNMGTLNVLVSATCLAVTILSYRIDEEFYRSDAWIMCVSTPHAPPGVSHPGDDSWVWRNCEGLLWCRYTHRRHAIFISVDMEKELGKTAFKQVRSKL